MTEPIHFKGKSAFDHLVEARMKGKNATEETHGVEMPGHLFSLFDAAKETAILLLLLTLIFFGLMPLGLFSLSLSLFVLMFMLWKFGRSSLLGWTRLERLHRLIEEERWEIEHHRHQERKELIAMYQAKGFSGKLLEEVVDVLMADDNRLLQVMLQEELGLTLETFEHPLKQGFGAFLGVLISALLLLAGFILHPHYGTGIVSLLIIAFSSGFSAKKEKNPIAKAVIWNTSLVLLIAMALLSLKKLFIFSI